MSEALGYFQGQRGPQNSKPLNSRRSLTSKGSKTGILVPPDGVAWAEVGVGQLLVVGGVDVPAAGRQGGDHLFSASMSEIPIQ